MSVLRKEKKSNFTVIDNAIFKDRSLSLKAMGLLCLMLSLPDGWEYSVKGLQTLVTDKYSAITSGLKELEQAGYFRREQRFEKGKFAGYEYIISETKNLDFTFSENPISENTISENPTQLNTKELNTKESTTKDIYPAHGKPEKVSKKQIAAEFEDLWSLYPRKQGKDKAISYYEKARRSGTTYDEVKAGILAYRAYIDAEQTESRFIKHGSTFFSQKAWLDDWSIQPRSTGNPFLDLLSEGGL
jgi:hypothetical protein